MTAREREGGPGTTRPRLLIIGVDSVTFRLLRPFVEAGHLPTLGKLMTEGAQGELLSTVPSVTPPGWTSSYTGVNPAKHNVFDFRDHQKYLEGDLKYDMATVTSGAIKADPFWRILNRAGQTVGIVNGPMLYPTEEMDGYLVAGFPCPTEGEGLVHPPDLEEELREAVPGYRFFGNPEFLDKQRPGKYLEGINGIAADRARASLHLATSRPTDVVAMIFTEVDRVQHFFWASWDEDHPVHSPERARFRDAMLDHYRIIDEGAARLMEAVGPDVPVLVYSDHGAAPIHRICYVNTHLVSEGMMVMGGDKGPKGEGDGKELRSSRLDRKRLERALKRLGMEGLIHKVPKRIRRMFPVLSFETVDWSRTRAYFSSDSAQSVTVNLKGREPEGCVEPGEEYEAVVEEVIAILQRLRDPATGRSPFSAIYRREELWDGPYIENGPDVVTEPASGYLSLSELKDEAFMDVGTSWRDKSADHEREGIVILHGPGVRGGEVMAPHHIEDIAPTILHLCGLPVPRYMDGSVMLDAFEDRWLAGNPVTEEGDDAFSGVEREGPSMTLEEEEQLKERLRGLGYLG